MIHRRNTLRAEKILQERLFKHPKIDVIWDHVVEEFIGSNDPLALKEIKLRNVNNNSEKILKATGAFMLPFYANDSARDTALSSPAAGMVVFNTTGTKFQGYTGASWVDLN